jgi:hypothetical protein
MKTGPNNDDLELIPALNRAYLALRIEALEVGGLEGLHLNSLATAVEAELRIQVKKRQARPGRREVEWMVEAKSSM